MVSNQDIENYRKTKDRAEKAKFLDSLVKDYHFFISKMIKPYLRKTGIYVNPNSEHKSITYDDLYNSCFIGVMEALERFDTKKGYTFLTFAKFYIHRALNNHATKFSKEVRIPPNQLDVLRKYNKQKELLERETGKDFTVREVVETMDFKDSLIENRVKDIKYLNSMFFGDALSIDPLELEYDEGEQIDAMSLVVIDSLTINRDTQEEIDYKITIDKVLNTFAPRDAFILKSALDLDGSGKMTYKEISEIIGESRRNVQESFKMNYGLFQELIQKEIG